MQEFIKMHNYNDSNQYYMLMLIELMILLNSFNKIKQFSN